MKEVENVKSLKMKVLSIEVKSDDGKKIEKTDGNLQFKNIKERGEFLSCRAQSLGRLLLLMPFFF